MENILAEKLAISKKQEMDQRAVLSSLNSRGGCKQSVETENLVRFIHLGKFHFREIRGSKKNSQKQLLICYIT